MMAMTGIDVRCGGLFFTSKFDSGNLARVEKVGKEEDAEGSGKGCEGPQVKFEMYIIFVECPMWGVCMNCNDKSYAYAATAQISWFTATCEFHELQQISCKL